jgi:1-acyl-sn-glycerol-3-phosphate acyltransferase
MMGMLKQAAHLMATASAFLFFFLGGAVLSFLVIPVVSLSVRSKSRRSRLCRRIVARSWVVFHDYMRLLRLIDYDPRAARLAFPAGAFVLVANHPTLVDVTALVAACPDLAFIAKSKMFRSPVFGRLLRTCGHINGGEGGPFSGAAAVDQVLECLAAGIPVLIFPEGTRSPRGGLGAFRHGACQIARKAGVPIVPVFVTCDPPTLMRGQAWYAIPKRLVVLALTQLPILEPPVNAAVGTARLQAMFAERMGATCADAR